MEGDLYTEKRNEATNLRIKSVSKNFKKSAGKWFGLSGFRCVKNRRLNPLWQGFPEQLRGELHSPKKITLHLNPSPFLPHLILFPFPFPFSHLTLFSKPHYVILDIFGFGVL